MALLVKELPGAHRGDVLSYLTRKETMLDHIIKGLTILRKCFKDPELSWTRFV